MRDLEELDAASVPPGGRRPDRLLSLLLAAERRRSNRVSVVRRDGRDAAVPLSYGQERLWFLARTGNAQSAYNLPLIMQIGGELDRSALERSLVELVARHETLRTRFVVAEGVPSQRVEPAGNCELRDEDVSGLEPGVRERRLHECLRQEQLYHFDLGAVSLLRALLVKLSPATHVLVLSMHHIVSDGWSLGIIERELSTLYRAYARGCCSDLPDLPIQYSDYVLWQREWLGREQTRNQLKYWKECLQGAPAQLELPTDRPRPPAESFKGAQLDFDLPLNLVTALNEIARAERATLFMIMLAAFQALLSRLSGQQDLVVGTSIAGRRQSYVEGLIGCFVNTLALRARIPDDDTFRQFLRQVRESTLDAYAHQDVPFEMVVRELRPERTLARQAIVQVMLTMQNYPQECPQLSGVQWTRIAAQASTAHVDLTLYLRESPRGLHGSFVYATDLFDECTVARMAGNLRVLLEDLAVHPECPIGKLAVLSTREKQQMLVDWNSTAVPYPHECLIHELIEDQARRAPGTVAVRYGDLFVTYDDLNRRANRLARHLRLRGVGPSRLVALCIERSIDLVVGLLAVLKAGGAYVPLDPGNPGARLEQVLLDARPSILLTHEAPRALLPSSVPEVILLDTDWPQIEKHDDDDLDPREMLLDSSCLAYVIYTSGSTGTPKGVMIEHRSLVNYALHAMREFDVVAGSGALVASSLSFDLALTALYPALIAGQTVHLCREQHGLPMLVEELCATSNLAPVKLTPSHLTLLEDALRSGQLQNSVRTLVLGGEQLHAAAIQLWRTHAPATRIFNHYGPTETTIGCIVNPVAGGDIKGVVPLGRPIANTRIYVLDGHLQLVPIGVTGEIYIAGAGVARGYWNRPELTAQRFLPDPFSTDPQARMYRSGDQGRWRADGVVEYLGRNDHQVKIRGHRIELGEIETQLLAHRNVRSAVALAREDTPGDKRLVAYVVCERAPQTGSGMNQPDDQLLIQALREHLKTQLPEYMVPSSLVVLDELPLTANGKVDRRALPIPQQRPMLREFVAPRNACECTLADIWRGLLRVDRIGVTDNFFELGGHSLLVLSALFRINASFGCALEVSDMYRNPTIIGLAARIGGNAVQDRLVELEREAVLREPVATPRGSVHDPAEAILLTGATGFVGRFLLRELLQNTSARIYCLVRAQSPQTAALRVRTTLANWALWHEGCDDRIVAIPGDVRQRNLGLDDHSYGVLSDSVDTVFHCGASMNHLETYEMAKAANVESIQELLRPAVHRRPKLINYISTTSVFAGSEDGAALPVDETSPIDNERHRNSAGYVASKWVGEKLLMLAAEHGIACNVFRLGLVWADAEQGRYDELQREYRILHSCIASGFGIKDYHYQSAPLSVDYIARALTALASAHPQGGGRFHLCSAGQPVEDIFGQCNGVAGLKLQLLPMYDWMQEMKRLHELGRSMSVVPLIQSAFSMDENSFDDHRRRIRAAKVCCSSSQTQSALERIGIPQQFFSADLIRLCVDSMLSRDSRLRETVTRRDHAIGKHTPAVDFERMDATRCRQ